VTGRSRRWTSGRFAYLLAAAGLVSGLAVLAGAVPGEREDTQGRRGANPAAEPEAPASRQQRTRPNTATAAPAFEPASGTPLARHVHPRLFIVADGSGSVGIHVTALKERLRTVHRSSFQTYIDALDAQRSKDPGSKGPGDVVIDGIGYALLSLVEPRSIGFHTAETAEAYAALAKRHALAFAPAMAKGEGDTDDLEQISRRRGPASMGAALIYDWTVPRGIWTDADRQALANAFIAAFDARMRRPWRAKFAMSEGNPSRSHQGQYGALAMWGDPVPGTASTGQPFQAELQRMLDQVHADWYGYLLPSFDFLLGGRSGWPEGPNYAQEAYNASTMIVGALSTALDDNLFASSGYLHYWPLWVLANARPTPLPGGALGVLKMNTSTVRDSIEFPNYGRTLSATAATLQGADDTLSSLSKWMIEHWHIEPPRGDMYVRGYWWLWRFIWGYEHLPAARTPDQLQIPHALRHGQGVYTLRSGYGSASDTAITFIADENASNVGGHAAITNSSFTIEKFGNLVIQGGNRKSGPGRPHVSSQLDFALVGVYKPGEQSVEGQSPGNYMGMKYQRIDGANAACAVERCGVGRVLAEALNRRDYDFVSFDYSKSWDPAKVTRASRDFVYLHPPGGGEYAVIVDRVTAADPSYQKRWHIKVPFDLEAASGGSWHQVTAPAEISSPAGTAADTPANEPAGRGRRARAGGSDEQQAAAAARQARREQRAAEREARLAARGRTPRAKTAAKGSTAEPSPGQDQDQEAERDPDQDQEPVAPSRGRQRALPPHAPVPGGVWEAPGSAILRMVNRYGPAHGVLFVRSIGPSGTTFRKIGGDGYEFRDADLANYNRDTPPFLTDDAADVMGRYRLEIIPGTAAASDVFVTLLQFGDANQLTQMTPSSPVTVSSGGMAGVAIMDPGGARVLLFSSEPGAAAPSSRVVYTVTGARSPVHVLFNMRPGATYYVATKTSGDATEVTVSPETFAGGTAVAADQDGILSFGPDGRQTAR
jgi:hypothetical protein